MPHRAQTLAFIHAVERLVGENLEVTGAKRAVRCRVRAAGIVVELDSQSLASLPEAARITLGRRIAARARPRSPTRRSPFAPYRAGSAFLTGGAPR